MSASAVSAEPADVVTLSPTPEEDDDSVLTASVASDTALEDEESAAAAELSTTSEPADTASEVCSVPVLPQPETAAAAIIRMHISTAEIFFVRFTCIPFPA